MDGRMDGRTYDFDTFLGCIDFLTHGAPLRMLRALEPRYHLFRRGTDLLEIFLL